MTATKVKPTEVQEYLREVLLHPLPQIRRELLDYLLQAGRAGDYGLTLQVDGAIQVLELTAEKWQELLGKVLDAIPALPAPQPHTLLVQDLQAGRCTLLRGSLVLGISQSKVKALRKGLQPTRQAVAPVTAIFRALLEGTRPKEIAVRFGVTDQTVSNVRSRVLDLLLYEAVQQFVCEFKVAY
jgi:DNA-binding NarL/FixJ family response regulator